MIPLKIVRANTANKMCKCLLQESFQLNISCVYNSKPVGIMLLHGKKERKYVRNYNSICA